MKRLSACYVFAAILMMVFAAGCQIIRSMGKNPDGAAVVKFKKLINYHDGHFINVEGDNNSQVTIGHILNEKWNSPKTIRPQHQIPVIKTELINAHFSSPTIIWFGHSSFLLKIASLNILVDPDFSDYAGPIDWFNKAFEGTSIYTAADMPAIDILMISHDHYDHLDYETIKKLKNKVKMVVVPDGVGAHFRYWGYDTKIIHELNWNDSTVINNHLTIIATRARHSSRRSIYRDKTLWASYVIIGDGRKLFYSGDTGYGSHFKQIGKRYGPFDLALMECGQYGRYWPHEHMFPAQSAQASADINAKVTIPVHWAKFAEAYHPWNQPIKEMLRFADSLHITVSIPQIGQPYTIGQPPINTKWWATD